MAEDSVTLPRFNILEGFTSAEQPMQAPEPSVQNEQQTYVDWEISDEDLAVLCDVGNQIEVEASASAEAAAATSVAVRSAPCANDYNE